MNLLVLLHLIPRSSHNTNKLTHHWSIPFLTTSIALDNSLPTKINGNAKTTDVSFRSNVVCHYHCFEVTAFWWAKVLNVDTWSHSWRKWSVVSVKTVPRIMITHTINHAHMEQFSIWHRVLRWMWQRKTSSRMTAAERLWNGMLLRSTWYISKQCRKITVHFRDRGWELLSNSIYATDLRCRIWVFHMWKWTNIAHPQYHIHFKTSFLET